MTPAAEAAALASRLVSLLTLIHASHEWAPAIKNQAVILINDTLAALEHGPLGGPVDEAGHFLAEVRAELLRARVKFPGDRIMTIALAEEFGELCKAVLDEPSAKVRAEAVQTATMACRVAIDGDSSVDEWRRLKGLDPLTCSAIQPSAS
jgi:hypothetical protein